ncbi:antitoxin MazE family protein [Mycolicibacterium hippocampi]|uniref:Antitoxin MazE n=1 Tax=Mycolicibacterium hippocampi TaxID=659824 RepID=A0A7I9ZLJ0_9MYCO|nr:antitoxin MazE family protein [Mycolicibacterium hippocampi]GFH01900.1 antitoxin MazE [Mycolicibacterium hippocampi]
MPPSRERVRRHRERLRQQGLRPIQVWVPDVTAPEFVREAHRQSALLAADQQEREDQAFVDAISDDWDDSR